MMNSGEERLEAEVALLQSMYPGCILYDPKAAEIRYRSEDSALCLRLPDSYLVNGLPEVVSASAGEVDLRKNVQNRMKILDAGEEVLDSIVLEFVGLADSRKGSVQDEAMRASINPSSENHDERKATIVVWLHHLLNLSKRKKALSPSSPSVSGITKPGYPGVLVYSGPSDAVHEHVNELKQLNWQAFQIRLESEEEWTFAHGSGVVEVEAMKDVTADVEKEERREEFVKAMRMK